MATSVNYNFPIVTEKLGLGMGMDLEWDGQIGFIRDGKFGAKISNQMENFFDHYQEYFNYIFIAFQPKNRNVLNAEEYYSAYDSLFNYISKIRYRAFHHTLLNIGTCENYYRSKIFEFTNQLIRRYDFKWIVEDLGLWTVRGKTVPFPLPPLMTEEGLENCISNVQEVMSGLDAPLCLEFPGFTEGTNFHIGTYHAYDYFRILAQETGVAVTIDIGHILSYQWLIGNKGENMYKDLEMLPFENCFEFHLSGCQITDGKFRDLHHGILLDEQIDLLKYLLPLCPNLKAVTYEDPKYSKEGLLVPKSIPNFHVMKDVVQKWRNNDLNFELQKKVQ